MVKCDEIFAVTADFNCSELKETVIEAVFENRKICAFAISYRFCESKNYAAAVAQNYNVVGITDSFSESLFGSLPLFSDTFADNVIFVTGCPCNDFFIVFANRFFNNCDKFTPRIVVAAFFCKVGSVCCSRSKGVFFCVCVESDLTVIDFSFFYSVIESAPFLFEKGFFSIVVSDYEIVNAIDILDVKKRITVFRRL